MVMHSYECNTYNFGYSDFYLVYQTQDSRGKLLQPPVCLCCDPGGHMYSLRESTLDTRYAINGAPHRFRPCIMEREAHDVP